MPVSGPQKAALLMVSLGVDGAAEIFKHLSEEEIEQLTIEIAHLPKIEVEERRQVIKEFREKLMAEELLTQGGGTEYAREVLERVYGPQRAEDTFKRLLYHFETKPFEFVKRADPIQLLELIQHEHPQTIALILSYMPPLKAADIMAKMEPDLQRDVARRIATMDRINPEVIHNIGQVLREKMSKVMGEEIAPVGGVDSLVRVLQMSERTTEKAVIEALAEDDPELAEAVKKKMFVFEDILILDDRSIQKVLREIETADLALSLKGADDRIKEKVLNNLPKRSADMLSDEVSYLGPVRAADVADAKQKIINVVRQMEESEDIIISRGGKGKEAIIE